MFHHASRTVLAILSVCVCLSAHAINLRIVTTTPRVTISALHELHALTPQIPSIAEKIRALNQDSLSLLVADKRSLLQRYDPTIFEVRPDLAVVSKRVRADLIGYQADRGLATTGTFDAVTSSSLRLDDLDNRSLALAVNAVGDDRKVAILRMDTSKGMLWRLSVPGQPDVRLAALDSLGDDLNSGTGARPVIFAAATDSLEINKIQSSLRLSGGRTARAVPIVLSGEVADSLALLHPERLDIAGAAKELSAGLTFRQGKAVYRQGTFRNDAGARLEFALWANSKEQLLRLVSSFIEFAAAQQPDLASLAEIAARFRDYLFDRGYDFTNAGISFGTPESLYRQWAAVASRRAMLVS